MDAADYHLSQYSEDDKQYLVNDVLNCGVLNSEDDELHVVNADDYYLEHNVVDDK